jgi:Na+-transporting NADH:ubiquinone oxidoreductase subunit F
MMVFLKRLHKWVGLLIGLQVLLWLLSGLIISLLDPLKVSGQQWANPAEPGQAELQAAVLLEPDELPAELLKNALGIKLYVNRGQPVYRIQSHEGESLINAIDGSIIMFNQTDAETIAKQDYTGDGEISSIQAGLAPDMETRRRTGDYWKVDFSDDINTSLYISTASGEILERRNSYWRVRDFFWMLHIMDYSGRENFNSSLIIIVALIAIWLGISGFILLFSSFNRHDFYFLNMLGKPENITLALVDPLSGSERQLSLRKGSNLFLSLATQGINLPSICGGGGECGKCRVQIESATLPPATNIEEGLIPAPLRDRGFRLACQHEVTTHMKVHLGRNSRGH